MTAAIIIARGGSKRLPRKNVRPFCGLPLVAWSIIQAKCSHEVDEVFLSTDDQEIADIGEEYGARIIRRPDWPDANEVAANRVYLHAIGVVRKLHPEFNCVLEILPTSPLNKPDDFDRCIRAWRERGYDVCMPVIKQRESILYKILNPVKIRTALFVKGYKYAIPGAGWNVWNPRMYESIISQFSDLDKVIEAMYENDLMNAPILDYGYIEQEVWQAQEVDILPEFEYAEVLMEHFLLKGRGPEIYYKYGESREAKQGILAFGNANQQG
jgi:hypothetical protein